MEVLYGDRTDIDTLDSRAIGFANFGLFMIGEL